MSNTNDQDRLVAGEPKPEGPAAAPATAGPTPTPKEDEAVTAGGAPEDDKKSEPPLRFGMQGRRTLAIDIGGTGIKLMLLDEHGKPAGERLREETPQPATPEAILHIISQLAPTDGYERVSAGFPGVVVEGVIHSAPNLHPSWAGFDLAGALTTMTGKPARVINDAGMQGEGIIDGHGVEMVITLGTGMGCAIFVDGKYVPNVELAHHPLRKRKTYEEYIGNAARKSVGDKRWNRRVARVVAQILKTFNPRVLYLGGGNSRKLDIELPPSVRISENIAGLLGGAALWK